MSNLMVLRFSCEKHGCGLAGDPDYDWGVPGGTRPFQDEQGVFVVDTSEMWCPEMYRLIEVDGDTQESWDKFACLNDWRIEVVTQ
jgi:hypothetical protein